MPSVVADWPRWPLVPAAGLPRHELMARLVDLVEVGALLAVHLDVDEELVHELRGRLVLERFVRHDVAPMARGIADRQQDRLAGLTSLLERFVVPGLPVHGVVRVLLEVWARLFAESISHVLTMHFFCADAEKTAFGRSRRPLRTGGGAATLASV